ncbi:hypothetical protein ACFQ3N_08210 [Virgibacillus byunsanensis]|uniref:Lipoprotein n=1 Tax=Virgibacillus byunsanensis TaxID=570945 RepID=A0ABW3LM51_9BACI
MRKYYVLFILFLFLIGCSSGENQQVNENQKLSFEENIIELTKENDPKMDTIIDYDLKGDYIIVVYERIGKILNVAIIHQSNNGLEWIMEHEASLPTTTIADEGTPFVTIVRPRDEEYKEVNVFGKPAKLVTYYDNPAENVTLEFNYWIAYTDKNPLNNNDIEYIKE